MSRREASLPSARKPPFGAGRRLSGRSKGGIRSRREASLPSKKSLPSKRRTIQSAILALPVEPRYRVLSPFCERGVRVCRALLDRCRPARFRSDARGFRASRIGQPVENGLEPSGRPSCQAKVSMRPRAAASVAHNRRNGTIPRLPSRGQVLPIQAFERVPVIRRKGCWRSPLSPVRQSLSADISRSAGLRFGRREMARTLSKNCPICATFSWWRTKVVGKKNRANPARRPVHGSHFRSGQPRRSAISSRHTSQRIIFPFIEDYDRRSFPSWRGRGSVGWARIGDPGSIRHERN